jgi:hypothetical protein
MANQSTVAAGRPDLDGIRMLLERARQGDSEVLPRLREELVGHPEIWQSYGDLAAHAQALWIGLSAGSDLALREALTLKAEAMRNELAGPIPSPMERLLVDRIVADWLQLQYADAAVAQAVNVSLREAAFVQKRQDAVHRRYLQAIGALATLRKLLPAASGVVGKLTSLISTDAQATSADGDEADGARTNDPAVVEDEIPAYPGRVIPFEATRSKPPRDGEQRATRRAKIAPAS